MRRAEDLADQKSGDTTAFMVATEVVVQAEKDKRFGGALQVVNCRPRMVVGSRRAEEEAWAMDAAVAAHQEKEVMEVAEDATRQAVALVQAQSIDIATIESMAGPFLGLYRAAVDLVASADDAAEAEAYVVGLVVPKEQPDKEDDVSDDIEALFGDSSDGDVVMPATTDEQVALMSSFVMAHREEGTRQIMAVDRDALVAMLVVRANAAREAARVAEAEAELATREEAARAVMQAEELAEEAAEEATTQEEMARDRHRWDDDMATARHAREDHKLATQCRHRRNLARRQADAEGSNTVDPGWADDLM
jgi:hypothetical protein